MSKPSVFMRWRTWLRNLPIQDPIELRMAVLLEMMLLGIIFVLLAALITLSLLPNLTFQTKLNSWLNSGMAILVFGIPMILLRRGFFKIAVWIVISITIINPTYDILVNGLLASNVRALFQLTLAMILAGLVTNRPSLLVSYGLSAAAVAYGGYRAGAASTPTVFNFIFLSGIICLFLDQFSGSLRAALRSAHAHEQALQNKDARLRAIVENSPDLIFEIDQTGQVIFVNRYSNQLIGKNVRALVLPEYADMTSAAVDQCFQTGVQTAMEIQILTLSGRATWDAVRIAPIRQDGHITSLTVISTDITERKQAELALQKSEDMYRRAIMAAGAVPYYLDHRTRTYTFMGEGILSMTGYTAAEMHPDLWASLEQEGFPRGNLAHLTYEEADRITEEDNSIMWECDYRIQTRAGQTRWIADTSVKGLNEKGERMGVIGILQDITERKLAEQTLKRYADRLEMLRQIDHAILAVHSPEETALAAAWRIRKIVACERAGVTSFDLDAGSASLLAASHLERHELGPTPSVSLDDWGREEIEILKQGKPFINPDVSIDMNLSRLDQVYAEQGIRAWLMTPLLDQGRLIGALSLGRNALGPFSPDDISVAKDVADQLTIAIVNAKLYKALQTANADLEQRVNARTAELEAANKDLEAFSFSVSHDLRAPLRAVFSFSKVLVDDFSSQLEPQAKQFLGRVQESALKMNRLIEGLLTFARAGRQALAPRATDLEQMAQVAYDELKETQDPARQIEFTLADLPRANVDPTLFKQVFSNLISNALKYTGKRAVAKIEVGALHEKGETVIFVRDNGTGFDMKYADKLFGVFQRLHSEAEFEGTGVGLSTVARIVHKHGGRIWAEAAPDAGATFYLTLPHL